MEPMYLSIQTKETGQKIKKLLMEKGYTVRDIQDACGFENYLSATAVYNKSREGLVKMGF